jgi:hypothetical protein
LSDSSPVVDGAEVSTGGTVDSVAVLVTEAVISDVREVLAITGHM